MADQDGEGSDRARTNLALRLGLAGALGLGALVTGFILTRPGRKLVGDVLAGRERTPLEGRVLDALWSDRVLRKSKLDVRQVGPGRVELLGAVAIWEHVGRSVALAEKTKGVKEVETHIQVEISGARQLAGSE